MTAQLESAEVQAVLPARAWPWQREAVIAVLVLDAWTLSAVVGQRFRAGAPASDVLVAKGAVVAFARGHVEPGGHRRAQAADVPIAWVLGNLGDVLGRVKSRHRYLSEVV